jgi:hypothetical protein
MRFTELAVSLERAEHIAKHGVTVSEAREVFQSGAFKRGPNGPHGRTYIARGRTLAGRRLWVLVGVRGAGVAFLITARQDE